MSACAVLFASISLSLSSAAVDLDVARQALRDGLWTVARTHAKRSESPEARLIVLESLSREGDWSGVLDALRVWGDPEGEGFTAYRAAAMLRSGDAAGALALLDRTNFTEMRFVHAASRIRAEMSLAAGDPEEALRILKRGGGADAETKMLEADARLKEGRREKAEELWRAVASETNAPAPARLAAAANLADAAVLRALHDGFSEPRLRRLAGLHLGSSLLKSDATFEEGAKIIRSLVHASPDTGGARERFIELAQAYLSRRRWDDAADVFRKAVENWPDLARDSVCQEGLGWALAGAGSYEAALSAFERAAASAKDGEAKAQAEVKVGDMLSVLGRGSEATDRYRAVKERYPETAAGRRVEGILRLREMEVKARALYGEYRFADAQKAFEELALADPSRRARMELCIVHCLYGQGLDETAERRARALAEGNAEEPVRLAASRWLAKFAYNHGRWQQAADLFSACADARRTAPEVAAECLLWAARAALAGRDYPRAVSTASRLVSRFPSSAEFAAALLVQGEALIELARFDEAVLVFDRAVPAAGASAEERLRAQLLRADALFAMGADNPARYHAALEAYQTALLGENLTPSRKVALSFKIARTLEKLKRIDEAIDRYYSHVVLAYREGVSKGDVYDDSARAFFSRAAFRLAEEYESRGRDFQALRVLELVVASRVPAADEAQRRIERIRMKGDAL